MRSRKRRSEPSINSGSIADIAFLLLIFFMVTTSLYREYSVTMRLPPSYEGEPGQVSEEKVLSILINETNQFFLEGTIYDDLDHEDISKSLQKLIDKKIKPYVSITMHPNSNYKTYINVLSVVKASIQKMKENYAQEQYGKAMSELSLEQYTQLKEKYTIKISEIQSQQL